MPLLTRWWNHESQEAPCLILSCLKETTSIPDTDDLTQYWTDVDFIVQRQMTIIDHSNYYGQAVPFHYVDFGSSAMPCVLGARPEYVDKETIWAHPVLDSIDDILKVHHTFEHVKEIWFTAFQSIMNTINKSGDSGSIGWAGIWAPGSTFPLQEDFSYMISPTMFREFILPHLQDMVDCLDYPMYHLDGVGSLPHLQTLLEIDTLRAIQWIPGAGKEELAQWYPVIQKIIDHGKSVQVIGRPDEVKPLVDALGATGLLISCPTITNEQAQAIINEFY